MAFDTLQRWHETHHIDTGSYHINPPHYTPVPRYTPWPAIAGALNQVLPQLDPLEIARRRLAMKAMPLQQAKIDAQLRLLPYQERIQQRQLEMIDRAMGGQTPNSDWYFGPDGKWHKRSEADKQKILQGDDFDHTNRVIDDSIRRYMSQPTDQADKTQGPLPGLGGPPVADHKVPDLGQLTEEDQYV